MAVDTMFQPTSGSGSGTSSGSFVQDNFLDTSNKATNNLGWSSTTAKNPLSFSLNDNDTPQYAAKTLFIKNLVLVEDRSKWISNKPTYEIVWTENCEAVKGYFVGTVRVRQLPNGTAVDIIETGDLIGVTGVIRQIAWLINANQQTGTCLKYTDAVSGTNLTFGSSGVVANGVNTFAPLLHNSTLEDQNIHDFRVAANQYGVMQVSGVVVYTQNATSTVEFNPGSSYRNKTLVTSTNIVGATLPTITSKVGAILSAVRQSDAGATLISQETPYINTSAIGFSGTNLVSVTTGQGASFPQGSGIVIEVGTSLYVGQVITQSTDTLTVSPTLAVAVSSSNLYKSWRAVPSLAISSTYYALSKSIDFTTQNNIVDSNGFGVGVSFTPAYSDPERKYRVWGRNLLITSSDGVVGLGFNGNTAAFLQVDGDFASAEIEYHGQGIFNGTFSINGLDAFGVNAGSTGSFKQTVVTEMGPGWNSFVFTPGQSYIGQVLTKVNLYERTDGVTLGVLAKIPMYSNNVPRNAQNASLMALGSMQRIYADSLYLGGAWTRGSSYIFSGGAAYYGASTNCNLTFNYYGTNFAFIGTAGASMTATLDGSSIGFGFNSLKSVPTLAWHAVVLNYTGGATCILEAVDYLRPTTGEVVNKQNYVPFASLKNIPTVFTTQYTPQSAKDNDLWVQRKSNASNSTPLVWLKAFGMWMQLSIASITDDPNALQLVRTHGSSTGATNAGVQDVEIFNLSSWMTGVSSTLGARTQASVCDSSFNMFHTVIDGLNTSGAVAAITNYFNKVAWSAFTARGTPRYQCGSGYFNTFLYSNKGSTDAADPNGTAVNTADKWSGVAWGTGTAWTTATRLSATFLANLLLHNVAGVNGAGAVIATGQSRTTTDVVAAISVIPVASSLSAASASGNLAGLCSNVASGAATTAAYTWNGSAWSAALVSTYSTMSTQTNGQGFLRSLSVKNGGNTTDLATPQTNTEVFNSSAYSASTASATSRGTGVSSAI